MRSVEKTKAEIALTVCILRRATVAVSVSEALTAVEQVLSDTGIDLDSPSLAASDVALIVDMADAVIVTRAAAQRSLMSV